MWIVDGNNVMGARPDGWWRDREGAMRRLVARLDAFAAATGDPVAVVFDGRERAVDAARVEVAFAPHADDAIAARATAADTVVTSDRGLAARVPGDTVGAGAFRRRLEALVREGDAEPDDRQ
jgi:predicted RNA-binding protein with PIN domain